MSAPTLAPLDTPRRDRRTGFRLVAGVLTLLMALTGGHLLVVGWTDPLDSGVHRLQDLHWGVLEGLLLAVALGVQLRNPERHAGAMRVALLAVSAQLVVAVAALALDPFGTVLLLLVGLALRLHPARREVLRPRWDVDRALLPAVAAAAILLLAFALVQLHHHETAEPHDLLEAKTGWLGAAFCSTALALVLAAAVLLRSRAAARLSAAGLAVLGTASVLHPTAASSLGRVGGLAGCALAAALLVRSRRASDRAR